MAKLKNVTSELLLIGPGGVGPGQEPWLAAGVQVVFNPGDEKIFYDEDIEKSKALVSFIDDGTLTRISDEEPLDFIDPSGSAVLSTRLIAPDGSVWKLSVDNTGVIETTLVP